MCQERHSSVVSIPELLGTPEFIHPKSFSHVGDLLWKENTLTTVNHPVFELIGQQLTESKFLSNFWVEIVDKYLVEPSKINEIITLKILTFIFTNTKDKIKNVAKLLTSNFIKMTLAAFRNTKKKEPEYIHDFYRDLFEAILSYCKRIPKTEGKIPLLEKLLFNAGNLSFDSITSSDVVSGIITTMDLNDVKRITEIFREIVVCKRVKEEKQEWLNSERIFALKMINKLIQQSTVASEIEWRTEQLIFMVNLSTFYTSDGVTIATKGNDITEKLQIGNIKNILYQSLETKFAKIEVERDILLKLVNHINEKLSAKNGSKHLKVALDDTAKQTWTDVITQINQKSGKKSSDDQLKIVFDILLMHMGLQLFNDSQLALSAIDELKSCMIRSKTKTTKANEGEPEWIEVIVDLFLHLLSQNSSLLRNIITKVFPSLCPSLTLSSIHQILAVLDMTDGNNPLSMAQDSDSDDEEAADEEEEEENSDSDSEDDDDDADDAEEDDDDASDDGSDDESMVEDSGNVSAQLRSAITMALGSAAPDTDQESIDLDDITEEDATKLDNALSEAFRMYSENRNTKKKTKKQKIVITTVAHFRMRVLDLLEIYLRHTPKLSFVLEIIIGLYEMLDHCIKENSPLLNKVKGLLNKLTTTRAYDENDDVKMKNLAEILTKLIEKKFNAVGLTEKNVYLTKCGIFIINCSQSIQKDKKKTSKKCPLIEVYDKYLLDFIENRNPVLPLNIFTTIFTTIWSGIWSLTRILVEKGINVKVQSIRRTQVLGILTQLYKNTRFIQSNVVVSQENLELVESSIDRYLSEQERNTSLSQKVFGELLELLIEIHKCHQRVPEIKSCFDWTVIGGKIQTIRKGLTLESASIKYKKFCEHLSLQKLPNGKAAQQTDAVEGGSDDGVESDEEDEIVKTNGTNGVVSNKRKLAMKTNKAEKKQKKEARLKAVSKGLNGGLTFTNINGMDLT